MLIQLVMAAVRNKPLSKQQYQSTPLVKTLNH